MSPLHLCVLKGVAALREWQGALDDLVRDLAAENVFYEPWMLIPAIECMGLGLPLEFVLLFEGGAGGRLCGFFPLERTTLHRLAPFPTLRLWHHPHCSRCTPLMRKGYADACWRTVLEWASGRKSGAPILDLTWIPGDGEVGESLQHYLSGRRGLLSFRTTSEVPFLTRAGSLDEAYALSMSKPTLAKRRQELRKLQKMGQVTFADIDTSTDLDHLIDEFLALEAAGWKGRSGTALASNPEHARFYRAALKEAHGRGRLSLLQLRLDGRLLAARIMIVTGTGSCVPKIAYDEAFSAVGPGSLLEVEEMRRLYDPADPLRSRLQWSDSVATGGTGPLYRCWAGRIRLHRWWIGASLLSRMAVRAVPWLLAAQELSLRLRARFGWDGGGLAGVR